MDIVKYGFTILITYLTIDVNSLQPKIAYHHNTELSAQADNELNPIRFSYENTHTRKRQLSEPDNVNDEVESSAQSLKVQVRYTDHVGKIEETNFSRLPLRETVIREDVSKEDSREYSASENKKGSTNSRISHSKFQRSPRKVKPVEDVNDWFHIRKLFVKFGDGEMMTYDGFERLLNSLGLQRLVSNVTKQHLVNDSATAEAQNSLQTANMSKSINNNGNQDGHVCFKSWDLFSNFESKRNSSKDGPESTGDSGLGDRGHVNEDTLFHICPSILYQLTSATVREQLEGCFFISDTTGTEKMLSVKPEINMGQVWLFSTLSVIGVSVCGMMGVAMIPIMHYKFYQELLHFLISMAIGTLCGDALLHLLPHAMAPTEIEGYANLDEIHNLDEESTRKGLVAALAIVFFFFLERCLLGGGKWLRKRQLKKKTLTSMLTKTFQRKSTQVKNPSKPKTIVYPYHYGEVNTKDAGKEKHASPSNGHLVKKETMNKMAAGQEQQMNIPVEEVEMKAMNKETAACELKLSEMENHAVVIRENETDLHGHPHAHAHIHLGKDSISTIAYMVIMGDILDNLTDGVAIGAAFAASLGGGFSTVIAVFFHELPHELGDFAVLLKSGMSIKAVIIYNLMSSALCLIGMIGGVILGQDEEMLKWVFSVAAGLFLYIALVDMIPELTGGYGSESGTFLQLILQFLGLLSGLGIMLLVTSLENDLESMFVD